jgi:hypothetical protein
VVCDGDGDGDKCNCQWERARYTERNKVHGSMEKIDMRRERVIKSNVGAMSS